MLKSVEWHLCIDCTLYTFCICMHPKRNKLDIVVFVVLFNWLNEPESCGVWSHCIAWFTRLWRVDTDIMKRTKLINGGCC